MIREESAFLLFLFGISFTTNVALVVALIRGSRRLRPLESRVLPPASAPVEDRRLERIEAAVEGLASQVDQLASGQEFLNRVIVERRERPSRSLGPQKPEATPV